MGDEERNVVISTYTIDPLTQNSVRKALREVLSYYGCEELLLPIFTCINELLVNAVKANYKNIYFENCLPKNRLAGELAYSEALELFRLEIRGEGVATLSRMAKEKGMSAVLRASVTGGVMNIVVSNNAVMTDIERANISHRIEAVRLLKQLSDFFGEDDDPSCEGAGLGIVLVGMMLKSLGLSTDQFEINAGKESTTASLTIPLTQNTLEAYRIISRR
ncbi:MAG TPA: hypothetical protein VF857_09115 [Spirochaetota bacterium]